MGKGKGKKGWVLSPGFARAHYFKETEETDLKGLKEVWVAMLEGKSPRIAGPFPAEKAEEFLERAWEVGFDKAYREFGGQ